MDDLLGQLAGLSLTYYAEPLSKRDKAAIKDFLVKYQYREDPLYFIDNYPVYAQDCLITLQPDEWMNDATINAFLRQFNTDKVYLFNTFFYSKLSEQGFPGVSRWTKKVDLSSMDLILVPINTGSHWLCAVVDLRKHKIIVYNSMRSQSRADQVGQRLESYLNGEWMAKDYGQLPDFEIESAKCPQQKDGSSCGVYTCLYLASHVKNQSLQQFDPDQARFRIVESLIKPLMDNPTNIYVRQDDSDESEVEIIE